jgi:putative addiction module component (TIGR02574 family)
MSVTEIREKIAELSTPDRIKLAMWLWGSIGDEESADAPAWHAEELQRREQEIASGEAKFIPWGEAKADILRRTS